MVTARSDIVRDRYPRLAQILDLLTRTPGVRSELLEDIRRRIESGEYLTEEKLNVAICRLLKDILG
ncbi:MAG: hypothetical protein MUE73_05325 [Planctomycetes bacterium]|nr:hypothetical protein [Planctomycetota bacterium]